MPANPNQCFFILPELMEFDEKFLFLYKLIRCGDPGVIKHSQSVKQFVKQLLFDDAQPVTSILYAKPQRLTSSQTEYSEITFRRHALLA
jgi:hypothetical protein